VLGIVALVALAAALGLYLGLERTGPAGIPLAVLRAAAWGSVMVLLFDPGCRRVGGAAPPVVLLDRSLSMSDPLDTAGGGPRWRAALDSAHAIAGAGGRILAFGAEPAGLREGMRPDAPSTRLLPAWREATALGGPLVVVTDGEVDDARNLPADFLRTTRIVVLPRPARTDVGVAGFDLPPSLRAGDTATATVSLVAAGTAPSDTATLELLEGPRVVARERVAVGSQGEGGGSFGRELRFVPAPPAGERETRRYEARVRGVKDDGEPRDDARAQLAEVTRASTVALFSDSPDWDFRALVATLVATSGVPVSAFVHVADGPWRDARSLKPVPQRAVDEAARGAALVVVHGTPQGATPILALARHSVWRWTSARGAGAGAAGDWYVVPSEASSPLGAALAGVPADSLPPLETLGEAADDSTGWTALTVRLARRGRPRPSIVGSEVGGRRTVRFEGAGLWRWAGKGGVAAEAYRALVAAATDWLLVELPREGALLAARRDSLNRGLDELVPRPRTLASQPGRAIAAAGEPVPLRHVPWVYAAVLAVLMVEWIARRRRGMR
jgi:hypothetical protein